MSFEVHSRAIPHFKADIRGKLEQRGQRCGGTLILCFSPSKIAHLVHTKGLVQFVSLSNVG